MDYEELAEMKAYPSWLILLFFQLSRDACILQIFRLEREAWSLDKNKRG